MPDLLGDLDPEQRAAAEAVTGPVCIIAGAGTGKTRTVTYRLAHGITSGQVDARRALAVTHSKKAAAELAERLRVLGVASVEARTFHAAGLRVASRFWARAGRPEPAPRVLAEGEAWRLWRDSVRAVLKGEADNATVRDVVDEVGWARSQIVDPDRYAESAQRAGRHSEVDPVTVVGCWERYEALKTRQGQVDFADLLEIAATLIAGYEEVAEAVRHRWAQVTVDEYQDTDPAQQRLLEAIVGESLDVCVVGDPRQAIYSWKGADPSYLSGFRRRYPTARVFDLTRNYRSSPQIISWANSLAREPGTKALTPTRSPGRVPKVHQLDSEPGEAAWVAGAARRATAAGTPVSEIAVLYRFNATQARFEAAFARAEIPTVVAEDVTFFERDEIRAVLIPFGRAARTQPEDDGLELVGEILARGGFDRDKPPPGLGAARTRWESQLALLELLEDRPNGDRLRAAAMLSEINQLALQGRDRPSSGITLATLHRAKGLEWDLVFIVGVTDGAVPSVYATTPAEHAEEERLLHVGVSRARRELHLTWAATNARGWTNRPSPFLEHLPSQTSDSGSGRARQPGPRPARGRRARRGGAAPASWASIPGGGASCPHCAAPLKGVAARRLGVCSICVLSAPGDLGRRARLAAQIAADAASESGGDPAQMVSPDRLLRLLDRRPDSVANVSATPGVHLPEVWARKMADALKA